jgi:hypothetical protein
MNSLPGSFHTHSLPGAFVESVTNNHVPPDSRDEDIATLAPFPDRHSLVEALNHTDTAIHAIEVSL